MLTEKFTFKLDLKKLDLSRVFNGANGAWSLASAFKAGNNSARALLAQ